jgi:hypothetical protein
MGEMTSAVHVQDMSLHSHRACNVHTGHVGSLRVAGEAEQVNAATCTNA